MMFDHAAGHRHATREEAMECFRCAGAQAVPPLDSLSEALHEAGIGCSSEVCEPTTEFHQGIRRTMHDTDARALFAALHPEDGPQKHAAWCYLPKDHPGMCEGDQ